MTQTSAVLIYFAVETRNRELTAYRTLRQTNSVHD